MKFFLSSPATEWRPKIARGETVGHVAKARQAPERGERNVRRSIFCRPIRGLKFFFAIRPTVSPWATPRRASGALAVMVLLFAVCAKAEMTNTLSDAEIQGRQLAQQLYWARPETNFSQTGLLKFRNSKRKEMTVPLKFNLVVTATNWQTTFYAGSSVQNAGGVLIVHADGQPNVYFPDSGNSPNRPPEKLTAMGLMSPFAPGSDFWVFDLGLEFFHWPEQKVLKKEFRRNCSCAVLESANPHPVTNGYSRVDSWIDEESSGIVMARAYDANGKLLKEFLPKDVKKVNGEWQVQSMEIDNVQTGSRTRLEFDLKAP